VWIERKKRCPSLSSWLASPPLPEPAADSPAPSTPSTAVNAVNGLRKLNGANGVAKRAKARYDAGEKRAQEAIDSLNERAAAYGEHQAQVAVTTIARFIDAVRRLGQGASSKDLSALEGFDRVSLEIDDYEGLVTHANAFLAGGLKAAGAALGAHQGAIALAGLIGTASTGTAISGLSGAALANATAAWWGGGSLATGGLGMAGGAAVLGTVTAGPAILISGLVLNGQGEKAKTKAAEFAAEVNVALAEQQRLMAFLERVGRRVDELDGLLGELDARARSGLERLEDSTRQNQRFAETFQETAMLVHGVAEILRTPVVQQGDNGKFEVNEVTDQLLVRHRRLNGESYA
jgi:hypothetical protein